MKSSDDFSWTGGLLGLFAGLALLKAVFAWQSGSLSLEPQRRLGYSRTAAKLADAGLVEASEGSWFESFQRALRIQLSTADRLRVDPPMDEELVLLETDVLPPATFDLLSTADGSWELSVKPWQGKPWTAPSGSGGAVLPAAYPANGRIAYYDLGRIWIADINGLRMQSLQHVPLLGDGGQLMWDYAGTRLCWMGRVSDTAAAVELGAFPLKGK